MINLDGDNVEVVHRFSYLGDVISTQEGAQEAVTSRIRSAWKKFKEVSNVVCGKSISLKVIGTLYKSGSTTFRRDHFGAALFGVTISARPFSAPIFCAFY